MHTTASCIIIILIFPPLHSTQEIPASLPPSLSSAAAPYISHSLPPACLCKQQTTPPRPLHLIVSYQCSFTRRTSTMHTCRQAGRQPGTHALKHTRCRPPELPRSAGTGFFHRARERLWKDPAGSRAIQFASNEEQPSLQQANFDATRSHWGQPVRSARRAVPNMGAGLDHRSRGRLWRATARLRTSHLASSREQLALAQTNFAGM